MALPRVVMQGNLVADPSLNFSKAGKPILKLRVAANENKRNDDGSWSDGASCFLDVTVFEPHAEPLAEELNKGMPVLLTGRLQQREWTTQEGAKRTSYEVIAESVGFIPKAKANGSRPQYPTDPWAAAAGPGNQAQYEEPPF
jgi:single-strand DNA-binding protein